MAVRRTKIFDFEPGVSGIVQTRRPFRFKQLYNLRVREDRMSPQQIDELRKKAENYLERAAEAADPQDQRLWLGLARDSLTLVSDAHNASVCSAPLAPSG
jgi:hypothetical protein